MDTEAPSSTAGLTGSWRLGLLPWYSAMSEVAMIRHPGITGIRVCGLMAIPPDGLRSGGLCSGGQTVRALSGSLVPLQ